MGFILMVLDGFTLFYSTVKTAKSIPFAKQIERSIFVQQFSISKWNTLYGIILLGVLKKGFVKEYLE